MGIFTKNYDLEEAFLASKVKLKELEFEKRNMEQELELSKKKQEALYQMENEKFLKEKKMWEEAKKAEMSNLKGRLALSTEQTIADAKHQFEKALQEVKNDYAIKLQKEKEKMSEELNKQREKLTADSYAKMVEALNDLHTKGNVTTKFIQDMTLKMLEKNPLQIEAVKNEK